MYSSYEIPGTMLPLRRFNFVVNARFSSTAWKASTTREHMAWLLKPSAPCWSTFPTISCTLASLFEPLDGLAAVAGVFQCPPTVHSGVFRRSSDHY